jgi:hypothetical protein
MKWQLFTLTIASTVQAAAALEPIGNPEFVHRSLCFTYLSSYLAPVQTDIAEPDFPTAPNFPTTKSGPALPPPFVVNPSTSVAASSRATFLAVSESSEITQNPTPGFGSSFSSGLLTTLSDDQNQETTGSGTLSPSNAATSSQASTTSSGAGVSGEAIILAIVPQTGDEKRQLSKRALGGFIMNGNVANAQICTDAAAFSLASGQLLDQGSPVYYSVGEPFKQLRGQRSPPDGAISTTFLNVGGGLF